MSAEELEDPAINGVAEPQNDHENTTSVSTWTQDQWTKEATRNDTVQAAIKGLLKSRAYFESSATSADYTELHRSQEEFEVLLGSVSHLQPKECASESDPRVVKKLRKAYDRAAEVAFRLSRHLNAMSTVAPAYVQAAWSVIYLLLMAQVNDQKMKDSVRQTLWDISSDFETLNALTSYAPTRSMIEALVEVYATFLEFLGEAIRFYAESTLKRSIKAVFKPMESRLQPILDRMQSAMKRLERRGQVASLGAQRKATESISDLQKKIERLDASSTVMLREFSQFKEVMERLGKAFFEKSEILADFSQQTIAHNSRHSTADGHERATAVTATRVDVLCGIIHQGLRSSDDSKAHEDSSIVEHDSNGSAVDVEVQSVLRWLESSESSILWVREQSSYENLFWNINLIEPAIADFITSYPQSTIVRCFCGEISDDPRLRTPTAALQVLIVQLIGNYRRTLENHPDLPTVEDLERSKSSFRLTVDIFDRCLKLCRPSFMLIIIDGLEQLYSSTDSQAALEETGSESELIDSFNALFQEDWLVIKILITANEKAEIGSMGESMITRSDAPQEDWLPYSLVTTTTQRYRELSSSLQAGGHRLVAFMELPLLYRPNTMVYNRINGTWQAHLVIDISEIGKADVQARRMLPLVLRCWRTQYVSGKLRRVVEDLEVQNYTGLRLIDSLDFVPAAFLPGETDIRTDLMKRGKQYCAYTKNIHYLELSGPYAKRYSIDGVCRVVVDMVPHGEQMESQTGFNQPSRSCIELIHDQASNMDNFKPVVYITCPTHIPAYDLERNTWIDVEVDNLAPVPHCGKGMLHDLNLDHTIKDVLTDTAEAYLDEVKIFKNVPFTESQYMTRNVGMLTLLHGPPASGMTFTVEVLAEVFERPLVRVIGNLMTEDAASQQQLRRIFEYARRWNAFVIMKDVDIFFQIYNGRTTSVAHAALSSLVRSLVQSFTGLLYIVTHRVTMFDPSHHSLFAITVAFDAWTPERRYQALINLLGQVGYDDKAEDWDEVNTWLHEELSYDENFDIRKMKNFVTVAAIRGLANRGRIRRYDLKHAAQMTSSFTKLMINQRLLQSAGLK